MGSRIEGRMALGTQFLHGGGLPSTEKIFRNDSKGMAAVHLLLAAGPVETLCPVRK